MGGNQWEKKPRATKGLETIVVGSEEGEVIAVSEEKEVTATGTGKGTGIQHLSPTFLTNPNIMLSHLIWNTMEQY